VLDGLGDCGSGIGLAAAIYGTQRLKTKVTAEVPSRGIPPSLAVSMATSRRWSTAREWGGSGVSSPGVSECCCDECVFD
jgi:hypothetical protein